MMRMLKSSGSRIRLRHLTSQHTLLTITGEKQRGIIESISALEKKNLSFFAKWEIVVSLHRGNRSSSGPSRVSLHALSITGQSRQHQRDHGAKACDARSTVKGVLRVCLERQTGWRCTRQYTWPASTRRSALHAPLLLQRLWVYEVCLLGGDGLSTVAPACY